MRVACFVMGVLTLLSARITTTDTNFFDVLCVIAYCLVPCWLIGLPLILEYKERMKKRK